MTSAYGAAEPDFESPPPSRSNPLDRNLAMFGYLCLFFTVLFAGVPAFVMVILAYARQGDADPVARSHLRFQIRTFWWCFLFTLLSAIGLIAAASMGLWHVFAAGAPAHLSNIPISPEWLVGLAAVALGLWAMLWTLIASVWGGFKLAVGAPIGRL